MLEIKTKTLQALLNQVIESHFRAFANCAEVFSDTLQNGNTIFWCGNGGSAAESSHLAAELIGRFKNNRRPLPSISLNADLAALTCIANDFGYEQVFARQLLGLGRPGDLLIVLSTSGESQNIIEALKVAKQIGVASIALLGKNGGGALSQADFSILIDSTETARIQEVHLLLGHTLCEYAEGEMNFG